MNGTIEMMSVAQVFNFRTTIKSHVNEVAFVSLAVPQATPMGLVRLARGMR